MGLFSQEPERRTAEELPASWVIQAKRIGLLLTFLAAAGLTIKGGMIAPGTLWYSIPALLGLTLLLRSKNHDFEEQLFIKKQARK